MATRDRFAAVRAMMRADRFAAASGMRLVEVGEGRARTRMRIRPGHLNGAGVVQGGAIFTLADLAFAAACNSHGTVALALDVSITFARAAAKGTLTAEAREVALSRKVSVVNVEVRDGKGELVAAFRGTAYRKEQAVKALAASGRSRSPPGSSSR
ncbi:MAG TPA: PaaI family thioesterase [Anaeromyxobacteraceae bacterium]|nr:PaaI family thioesterase [Anaeromyxobacteraceae bacterium]